MEYKVKKHKFKKEEIEYAEIFFDNGDCFPISKTEIVDISTRLYDKLVLGNDYWDSFCAVVESGYLKLKLQRKAKGSYSNPHLYNLKEYQKDRIGYIKNRLCNEKGISFIKLFNNLNWHFTLYCQVETTLEDDILTLKFVPQYKNQSYKSDEHTILLPEISKSAIGKLELDFENCEGVYIDVKEICEIQINFDRELCWGSDDYIRKIESGFLKIKLDEEINKWRENSLFDGLTKGSKGNKQIEKRLCGKKGFDLHDVCHLCIEYNYTGWGTYKRERLEIDDLRSEEEFNAIEKYEEESEEEFSPYYLGGYAEKVEKDTILITFGKTALKDKRCQNKLKEYSVFNKKGN